MGAIRLAMVRVVLVLRALTPTPRAIENWYSMSLSVILSFISPDRRATSTPASSNLLRTAAQVAGVAAARHAAILACASALAMRSRRVAEIPLQSNTVRGMECGHLAGHAGGR